MLNLQKEDIIKFYEPFDISKEGVLDKGNINKGMKN